MATDSVNRLADHLEKGPKWRRTGVDGFLITTTGSASGRRLGVVNMAAKRRSRVYKFGPCRISADVSECDKLEFGADIAARIDFCNRHFSDFHQIAGDSDSDKVTFLGLICCLREGYSSDGTQPSNSPEICTSLLCTLV